MNDSPAQTRQLLAVAAIGPDRPGLVHDLTRAITDCGGSIAESRMASLGAEFAMVLLVGGNWHALARLESELKKVADECGLTLQLRRLDQSGIVAGLSGFCAARSIDISEVATRCYAAAHTGAPMFAVQMIINVPARIHVSQLREEFMDYCDSMNLDAILEPVKS
jgi:glycine cleavage system transcriptional repressor